MVTEKLLYFLSFSYDFFYVCITCRFRISAYTHNNFCSCQRSPNIHGSSSTVRKIRFHINALFYSVVPSKPPGNVTVLSAHVSAITVTWSPIENASVNGILRGYKVYYRSILGNGSYSTRTVGPLTLKIIISDNLQYTDIYEVKVAGFTRVGVGMMSPSYPIRPGKVTCFL